MSFATQAKRAIQKIFNLRGGQVKEIRDPHYAGSWLFGDGARAQIVRRPDKDNPNRLCLLYADGIEESVAAVCERSNAAKYTTQNAVTVSRPLRLRIG
jgi:hypothetical protein